MSLSDKKMHKISKALDKETMKDMEAMPAEELIAKIVAAVESIKTAVEELEANEAYQQRKEDLAILNKGLSDVKKRQNAIIRYSQHLLEEKGK